MLARYGALAFWTQLFCLATVYDTHALHVPVSQGFSASRCDSSRRRLNCDVNNGDVNGYVNGNNVGWSRQDVLSTLKSSLAIGSLGILLQAPAHASAVPVTTRISACIRPPGGGSANCVSTASVKQVDLFITPWTWREGISGDEVIGRLKGAIASDATMSLEEQRSEGNQFYCRVRAARNFCFDEIEFIVNPIDRFVTFRSQQIEGPDNVSDFGANRKRLDELRKRIGVLDDMGADFASADSGPREGTVGQLKAFWGLQSGGGYESVLLDDYDE